MAARHRTAGNRRSRRSTAPGGIPAWFWLLGGILIGLAIAGFLMFQGYFPQITRHTPPLDGKATTPVGEALLNDTADTTGKPEKPRFDFFTVLPEMEVVVPEQELSRKAEPTGGAVPGKALDSYVLQAGSFRSAADAEEMKARLALLGSIATIHTVTVNDETWHRVRIGPFEGARKADEMRRLLDDNSIDTLVLKANP
jgi:hypothetical protein